MGCATIAFSERFMKKAGVSERWEDLPKKIPFSHTPESKILNSFTFLLEFLFHKKAHVLKTAGIITHVLKTPGDGQRDCPKHEEFYCKNKF